VFTGGLRRQPQPHGGGTRFGAPLMAIPDQPDIGVRPGDVLAGKYQVERVLGAGGMGVVVAAHHVQLDTKVAIKFLLPHMLFNGEAVARFAREAKAAVKITSEHVARVIDVGTLETGAPYMVMEYLEGGDLAAWLQQRGPLPMEQAVEFVLHACVAVAEAHGLGIVHRDLKPANLFCIRRPDGQLSVKVLDFGISKLTGTGRGSEPPGMSVTKTSAIMGSPLYMSPEQMQSAKTADAQSDIWALGVILYELLAGRVPFDGENLAEVAVKVAMQPPAPLRSYRPEVPPGLEAVVLKCLERERRSRYPNVAELAIALAEFAPKRARA
jgi:serine/threonine protein kinase